MKPACLERMDPREKNEATGVEFVWTCERELNRAANRFRIIVRIGNDQVELDGLDRDPLERDCLLAPRKSKDAAGSIVIRHSPRWPYRSIQGTPLQ